MNLDSTKQRIMNAALIEFLTKSYERASMNDIVVRSGITKGGIYHYFNGKEALYYEIIPNYLEQMADWTSELVKQSRSAEELFKGFFKTIGEIEETFFQMTGEKGINPFHYFKMMFDAMGRFSDLRDKARDIYRHMQEQVSGKLKQGQDAGIIRNDVDIDSIAFSFNALYEGTIMISQVDREAQDKLHRYIDNLWKVITTK